MQGMVAFFGFWFCFQSVIGHARDNDFEIPTGMRLNVWWDYSSRYTDKSLEKDPFYTYFKAARQRKQPTIFFNDIFGARISKYVSFSSKVISPRFVYSKNLIGQEWGTIYLPTYFSQDPSQWRVTEWQGFYNELFHLWWHFVFMKSNAYKADRDYLLSHRFLSAYNGIDRKENDRVLVQEEAFSETVSALMLYFKSIPYRTENKNVEFYYDYEKFDYIPHLTVPDSCHDEDPRYNCSKPVMLSVDEYVYLVRLMTQNEEVGDFIYESQSNNNHFVNHYD